ncbi:hypothetical protein Tco_1375518 [Tanacetum coccineum]
MRDGSSSDSNDEEYAMAVRDFKIFFRRKGKFVRQPYVDNRTSKANEDKQEYEAKKIKKICLMAHENEVLSDTPYYSSSSLDNESRQNEYQGIIQHLIPKSLLESSKNSATFGRS